MQNCPSSGIKHTHNSKNRLFIQITYYILVAKYHLHKERLIPQECLKVARVNLCVVKEKKH